MKNLILQIVLFFTTIGFSQETISEVLKKYNSETVPYISVKALANQTDAVILDAREMTEYNVSHLKNAIYVGYDDFDIKAATNKLIDKQQTIVIYCSIGVRSEDIGEQLKNAGYTNVFNLFGGIFEWKNSDFPIFDSKNKETDNVHTYSKNWSKWLLKGIKIYE